MIFLEKDKKNSCLFKSQFKMLSLNFFLSFYYHSLKFQYLVYKNTPVVYLYHRSPSLYLMRCFHITISLQPPIFNVTD